jgi:hypothetical protein
MWTSIPETVGAPWAVFAEEGRPGLGTVLARIRDVDRRWDLAPETRFNVAEHSVSLAELFPDSEYEIDERFRDVRVVRLAEVFDGAPLNVQLSVGVPLGGGVLAALEELERGIDPRSDNAAALRAAVEFGWRVARLYVAHTTGAVLSVEDMQALTPDWDVVRVVEVMALTFVQLEAVLNQLASPGLAMKSLMAEVARQSL